MKPKIYYERYDTLERFLEWEGIIGYTDEIWEIVHGDRKHLKEVNEWIDRKEAE